MLGAFGGWMVMLNFLRMIKSLTKELENFEVLLPDKATADMILLIANLQLWTLAWNLIWFL